MPARQQRYEEFRDFTGGLNKRADQFQLAPSESPDLLNVDVDPRGGFRMRHGVDTLNDTALAGTPTNLLSYVTSGVGQVVAQVGTDLLYSTGGDFTDLGLDQTVSDPCRGAVYDDLLYIANGTDGTIRWDGTTADRLTDPAPTDWSDDFSAPTDDHFPIAKVLEVHSGLLWAANTDENGTSHPSRLRFSHPSKGDAWREDDYLLIGDGDGDEITGLLSFDDRLLVFKERSVYAVFGYSPDTFQVQLLVDGLGAVSQEAVAGGAGEAYFFSWPDGVFRFDGKGFDWVFEPIHPDVLSGAIESPTSSRPFYVEVANRRVYVTVPFEGARRTFVYDPGVSKRGAWVEYDLELNAVLEWLTSGSSAVVLAAHDGGDRVLRLERSRNTDDFGSGGTHIDSYYTTAWLIGKTAASRKRWRRIHVVADSDAECNLAVSVYHDFARGQVRKRRLLGLDGVTGTAGVWNSSTWNNAVWGVLEEQQDEVLRGPTGGRARSIQIKVDGPSVADARWAVHAISVPYDERQVR